MEVVQCDELFLKGPGGGCGCYGFRCRIDADGQEREAVVVLHVERRWGVEDLFVGDAVVRKCEFLILIPSSMS